MEEQITRLKGQSFQELVVMTFDKKNHDITFLSKCKVYIGDKIRIDYRLDNPFDVEITEIIEKKKHSGQYKDESNRRDHYTAKFKY